ncbi:MAG: ABC1 kinase family protein [Myxococcota bacterium]
MASAFQTEAEAEEARRRALQRSAANVVSTFAELKGAAMKVGQMLSTDPELLPPEVTEQLSLLQRDAPAMPFTMVRQVVETALGVSLGDVFSSFSEQPIGAASIGQVHRAVTVDGQAVAVKVQYPGIADTIESDMKNLGALLGFARAAVPKERLDAYLDEITEVLKRESDYLWEADQLERFQTVLRNVPGVRTPLPVHELTRKNVLTMEFIEGTRLTEWLQGASAEERRIQGERLVHAYLEMVHVHGALHADPHPGNFLVDHHGALVFLDLGCVRDYELQFADHLIRIVQSLWRGDLDTAMDAWRCMGFRDEQVEPEVVYEYLELILEPLLVDKEFDFGEWPIHERGLRFVKDNPSLLTFAPPREALFYLRVLAGLRGLLGTAGVRLNAYRLARSWAEAHPSV